MHRQVVTFQGNEARNRDRIPSEESSLERNPMKSGISFYFFYTMFPMENPLRIPLYMFGIFICTQDIQNIIVFVPNKSRKFKVLLLS